MRRLCRSKGEAFSIKSRCRYRTAKCQGDNIWGNRR